MEIITFLKKNLASEFLETSDKKQIILIPEKLFQKLDNNYIYNRILKELFINQIFLLIIITFFLNIFFKLLFYNINFKHDRDIFLMSIIPSIYNYLYGVVTWNDFIIGNIICTIIGYFANTYLHNYLNYYIIVTFIIFISSALMLLFNSFSIPAMVYGLLGYTLIQKVKTDYLKYIPYVLISFIIMNIIIYINNFLIISLNLV
jgi:ABC-type phosphate transport system permease subunit